MSEEIFNLEDYIKNAPRLNARKEKHSSSLSEKQVNQDPLVHKLEALIAIRESSQFDYALFEGMIEQVLEPIVNEYPELKPLMEHGSLLLRPSADGDALRKTLGAEPLYGKGATGLKPTAWAVKIGRCRVIYALASAGETDSTGLRNSWVEVLTREVHTNIPSHLYTGPFSRLIRNRDVAPQLKVALRGARTRVHCSESREGFLVTNEAGSTLWQAFVDAAHNEWVATLTRLQTGVIYYAKQGKWPRGGPLPVVGYERVSDRSRKPSCIVADETQRAQVRAIIETAASGMSEEEAVKVMSEAGVRSRLPRGTGVEQPLLKDLKNSKVAARLVWQHLPTYLSGQYLFRHSNSVPGMVQTLGIPVQRDNTSDNGYFEFQIPFPLPEGGWHNEETIKLGIKRRLGDRQKKGGKVGHFDLLKPLTGRGSYILAGYEYRLMGDEPTYQLRRRPHHPSNSGILKGFGHYEGELVGRFTIVGLHRTVASLLRDLVLDVPGEIMCEHIVQPEPAKLEELLNRAEQADQAAARMREFAASTSDSDEQDAYRTQASEQSGLARSLRAQHKELLASKDRQVAFADTRQFLAAAELLERSTGGEPPALRQELSRIIGTLQIHAVANEPIAQVTLTAVVRTDFGAVTLGPVTRPILSTAGKKRIKPDPNTVTERNIRLAYDLLTTAPNTPLRKMLLLEGRAERRRVLAVLQSLLPNPAAASAFLDCPIQDVQRVVLNEVFLKHGYSPLPLSDGLDPLWIQEIAAIYLAPTWDWNKRSWASSDVTWARLLVSWIHRYHGDEIGVAVNTARDQMGLNDSQIYSLLTTDIYRYKRVLRTRFTPIEYAANYTKHARSAEPKRVRITMCPHCGTRELPHILRVPELPDGFLCSKCRRAPGSKIIFPAQYLSPWVGTQQGNRKLRTPAQDAARKSPGTQQIAFRIPPEQARKRGSEEAKKRGRVRRSEI